MFDLTLQVILVSKTSKKQCKIDAAFMHCILNQLLLTTKHTDRAEKVHKFSTISCKIVTNAHHNPWTACGISDFGVTKSDTYGIWLKRQTLQTQNIVCVVKSNSTPVNRFDEKKCILRPTTTTQISTAKVCTKPTVNVFYSFATWERKNVVRFKRRRRRRRNPKWITKMVQQRLPPKVFHTIHKFVKWIQYFRNFRHFMRHMQPMNLLLWFTQPAP